MYGQRKTVVVALAAAAADVLASSATVSRYLYQLHVCETDNAAGTWTVSRGADAEATRLISQKAITGHATDNEHFYGLLIPAGTALQGFADAATHVTLTIIYDEIPLPT